MKTAILSDIHGNMEAFLRVLEDVDNCKATQIFCLGDCIGYGPEPNKVLDKIKEYEIPTVLGNHELAILRPRYLSWFNPIARQSLETTRSMLTASHIHQISSFPRFLSHNRSRMVHGFPPDLPKMYLFQAGEEKLLNTFQRLSEDIFFLGHTHLLESIAYDGRDIERRPIAEGVIQLKKNHRYIINIGSVGQPRDGDNCAKYILWNTDINTIEVRYITYDITCTITKIKAAGLPEVHARRLL